jgi:predicted Co/Zn/Cd cation transporter (cation efflux family)
VRVIQPGRTRSVMAHVVLPEDHPITLAELDATRRSIQESLEAHHKPVISDIVFTANPEWGKLTGGK